VTFLKRPRRRRGGKAPARRWAALYDPVFTAGVTSARAIAAAGFVALSVWKAPAWAVVVAAGVAGFLIL
jgi:chromate transporter